MYTKFFTQFNAMATRVGHFEIWPTSFDTYRIL